MGINKDISNYLLEKVSSLKKFTDKGKLVVKLKKSIYGLRQAPLNFYNYMRDTLEKIGYNVSGSDNCVFSRREGNKVTMIAIHVDDFLVSSNCDEHIVHLKTELEKIPRNRPRELLSS